MLGLPFTGIAMAWWSGKGLPFFRYTIPGAKKPDGNFAKKMYGLHKTFGKIFTYLLPLHIGATAFHVLAKGQNLMLRFRFN
mmetsp:Transcript_41655/g.97801  ORF Transcript_41655/g.97801 Transcript_41655/m.97801 type:complete len:81 (-) Transcript_41655:172-414(-)